MTNDQTHQESDQLLQLQSIIDNPTNSKHSNEIIHTLIISLGSSTQSIKFKAKNALAILLLNQSNQSTTFLSNSISDLLDSTNLLDCFIALRSLSSILQIYPTLGLELVSQNHVMNRLDDLINLSNIPSSSSSKSNQINVGLEISEFLALATNHKLIRESIRIEWGPGSNAYKYLTSLSLSKLNDHQLTSRFAASLALIKLQITSNEKVVERSLNDEDLPTIGKLVRILMDGLNLDCNESLGFIVEGLGLLSEKGFVRKLLILNQDLLLKKFHKVMISQNSLNEVDQLRLDSSIEYGISTILKNLISFKEIQSEEDQVTEKLRKLATQPNQPKESKIKELDEDEEVIITDEEVYQWISNLLFKNHLLMELVGSLSKSESKEVRRLTGKILLNLIEKQDFRGKVLQDGGGRMVLKMIASLTINSTSTWNSSVKEDKAQLDPNDLPLLQALSKLLITTNPLLIFGPLPTSPLLISTIKPLTTLLLHPSSSLLQIFEALMALTNLSSLDERLALWIARTLGVLEKVEECLMGIRTGENVWVRRAATELICNLASTEIVLKSFIESSQEDIKIEKLNSKGKSRLHLLIALSYSEDLKTSLASSATLSILTEHSLIIRNGLIKDEKLMESLNRVLFEVLKDDLNDGLQFRVLSLLNNLMMGNDELMDHQFMELKEIVGEVYGRLKNEDQDEIKIDMKKLIENILKI